MNRPILANEAKQLSDIIRYIRSKISPEDLNDLRELLPLLLHDDPEEVIAAHHAFIELLSDTKGKIIPLPLSAKESTDDTIQKTSMADNK